VTLTLSISGESAGTDEVTLEVAGESDTDAVTVSVVVVDAASYLEQARSLLVQMREQVESLSLDDEKQDGGKGNGNGKGNGKSNGNGGSNGLSNKLDTAIERLDDLLEAIERGRPNETAIDNRIDAVGEQVEAFRRQLDALAGTQIPEEAAGALRYNADQVTSNLELATAADL